MSSAPHVILKIKYLQQQWFTKGKDHNASSGKNKFKSDQKNIIIERNTIVNISVCEC